MDSKNWSVNGIFAIKDSKGECFLSPFMMRTDAEAVRAFDTVVKRGDSELSQHPEDYFLYRVGSFDVLSGNLVGEEHKSLGCALDFKVTKNDIKEIENA